MKKLLLLALGAVFGLSSAVFAESLIFNDGDEFESWYAQSVWDLQEEGVMTGYDDGNFKPANYINRAEFAVVLDRYTENIVEEKIADYFDAEIMNILEATQQVEDFIFDSDISMAAVVMAKAGLKELEEAPYSMEDLDRIDYWALPEGYTGYQYETGGESNYPFYLHYEGEAVIEDTLGAYEAWYGPFYNLDPNKL